MRKNRALFFARCLVSVILIVSGVSRAEAEVPSASQSDGYDEIFQDGQVRAIYRQVYPIYQQLGRERREAATQRSRAALGEYPVQLLPALIDERDERQLSQGLEQVERALRLFLIDHYSHPPGQRTYEGHVFTREQIQRIIDRSQDAEFQPYLQGRPELISIPMAIDLLRSPDADPSRPRENFTALELNPGDAGGEGHVRLARKLLFDLVPEYHNAISPIQPPDIYFQQLAERARQKAKGQKVILYGLADYGWSFGTQFEPEMAAQGIEVFHPGGKKELKFDAQGAYLEYRGANGKPRTERIGYVMMGSSIWELDWSHPITKQAALVDIAESYLEEDRPMSPAQKKELETALKPPSGSRAIDTDRLERALASVPGPNDYEKGRAQRVDGFLKAVLDGRVKTNFNPGYDSIVGDKEFYTHLAKLIRFYLNEDPVFRFLPSEPDLEKVRANRTRYVFKPKDDYGGHGVKVGAYVSQEEFERAINEGKKNPENFTAQQFSPPSRWEGYTGDFRRFGHIDRDDVFSGAATMSRSVPGRQLHNLSQGKAGLRVPLVVRQPCQFSVLGDSE